ncbi:MAG TPA: hypothetical protein VGN35_13665 [Jatrophihabitantaceae bacterium]|jgi:hypothetical protein|nr:hypothetical protein [Jatrophihabitantaceae bacterium]
MDMFTMTPTAALRSRSESSFAVPSDAQAYWHVGVINSRGRTSGAAMAGIGLDVPTSPSMPVNNLHTFVRNPRTNAKPAAPPRGEPR